MDGDAPDLEQATSALMAQVGDRVRRARQGRGLPRRVLSDLSGVSARYLAQLETGEGNISLTVLCRVAAALEVPPAALLTETDRDPESTRVAELFARADTGTRETVLQILSARAGRDVRAQRVCLIGLRGAGKSTLGKLASARLGVPFVELNKQIEADSGMPLGDLMALYGPEGYRKLEADALATVRKTHDRVILAVAGGIVAEPATYSALLSEFHTIWVKARPEEHMERVRAQGDERPMAGNPEAMAQLRAILTAREAFYARAECELDTSGKSVEKTLRELLALIRDNRFL